MRLAQPAHPGVGQSRKKMASEAGLETMYKAGLEIKGYYKLKQKQDIYNVSGKD